jgi:uncharacterized membrane protein
MFNYWMLISSILFIFTDSVYLQLVRPYFEKQIQDVQGSAVKVNFLGVALCYMFLIIGINYFIIKPRKSVTDAFLLGIVIYGVYETTNYALFSNWSIISVIIDTLWGGLLFATTAYVVEKIKNVF